MVMETSQIRYAYWNIKYFEKNIIADTQIITEKVILEFVFIVTLKEFFFPTPALFFPTSFLKSSLADLSDVLTGDLGSISRGLLWEWIAWKLLLK